jgi:hypothetical protein
MAFGTVKADALTTGTKTVLIDELVEGDSLGTAAALNVGTASGNVVQLDGQARLPAVDGSQLLNLPAGAGTVQSVALQVPSGLTVSGSPIVSSGTFVVAYASGIQAFTTAESTKLQGIASGATANSPDATLLNRANHTGTQAASTISGLATVATTGAYSDLSGLPSIPSGTVTSVALQAPSGFTVSGSPIASSGTLAITYASGFQAFTSAESTKLASIASGATANNGTVTSVALSVPSGLVVSGSPITASGELAITYASGIQAFTTNESLKLASVASGAQVNVGTDLSYSGDTRTINSSTGSGVVLPLVSTSTAGLASATSFSTITYGASVALDFASLDAQYRTISLTGDLELTTSNLANGRTLVIRLVADGSQRTLTFPTDWKFLGTKPANIAASKVAVLSITAFGTTNADVVAAYAVQS